MLLGCTAPTPAATETLPPPEPTTEPPMATSQAEDYRDGSLPVERRVELLLSEMTLAEKIGQMTLVEKNSITPEAVTEFAIGAVLSGGGGYPQPNTPEAWAEMVDGFQQSALDTRLGIPILYGVDAVHGHNNVYGAVIFPHNVGLGATRSPDLVRDIAQVTAVEMAATGANWNYAPVVAVPQDIRWGRTYEAYGEDPALVTELGVAFVEGLQGASLAEPSSVLATPKHFVADGGTAWGTSRTENYELDQGDAQIDEATLRAIHLPPYQAAIEVGAQSIMVSYSSWQGEKLHGHEYLLTDVLKGELGFEGFVVSDWQAINQIDTNYYEAVVKAINAGIDLNMVPYNYELFIQALTAAVENGDVPETRIDDAVRRILRAKFEMGLFEHPFSDSAYLEEVGSAEHRELARQAVRESLVLLKNDSAALPVADDARWIFVAGEAADNLGMQAGGWTIEWQGKTGNSLTEGTTILDAIEERAEGAGVQVQYNRFADYERITDDAGQPIIADVGIVIVAERPYAEGRGDSDDLTLSEFDVNAIQRMRERSERVVVLILSGRPLVITDQLDLADAWVAAWLPGTEGQGVADVLFGDYPFTGKLPYSWPRAMGQIPFDFTTLPETGYDAPLFPYGYGLDATNPQPVTVPECVP